MSDIVGLALRQIGIGALGTTPSPADIADGVTHLNMMLAQWQQRGWMIPSMQELAFMSTGASSYSVGDGGTVDPGCRVTHIVSAFARLATTPGFTTMQSGDFSSVDFSPGDFSTPGNGLDAALLAEQQFTSEFRSDQFPTQTLYGPTPCPLDFPLTIIKSYEEYASIGLKGIRTWPYAVFFNPGLVEGDLRIWPIPAAGQFEIHIVVPVALPANLQASSPLAVAPEYWDAIMWSLAARLAPSYGQEASQTVATFARAALSTIRLANRRPLPLRMPSELQPINGGQNPYWIYTGGF